MKKAYLGLSIIILLGMTACQSGTEELPPLPTLAVTAESAITENVTPNVTVTPTPAPEKTKVLEVTETLTATPEPAVTTEPTPTPKPTVIQEPTATPKPTATVTPKTVATAIPTATPKPTEIPKTISPEIEKLLRNAAEHKNTVINGTVCKSEAEANAYVREMALTYSSYALIVEDASHLHSAKEYRELYPEIKAMTIEKIERYRNGICMVFADVDTVYDANLCYAIRTGDRSVLSDTEQKLYVFLNEILDTTEARKLTGVDAVKVLHDYLVLNLKYDSSFQIVSHSPEGVMKNKTAVCDGYARTLRLLLLLLDMECEIVSGTADNESHAWNLVKTEDGWYHVDVTWDDPVPDVEGKVSYLYFLKNDSEMAKTHCWESEIICNGTAYEGYAYRELFCDSYEVIRSVYEKQIQTEEYLVFCYPKDSSVTEQVIFDFLKSMGWSSISYYPETELTEYYILEIVNPYLKNS